MVVTSPKPNPHPKSLLYIKYYYYYSFISYTNDMVQHKVMTRIVISLLLLVWEKLETPEEKPTMRSQDVQSAASMFLASDWDKFSKVLWLHETLSSS